MNIILGQMRCSKCGRTYPTCCVNGCPTCDRDKYFDISSILPKSKINFYVAPARPSSNDSCDYAIFLGGTIEGGKGIDWQKELSEILKNTLPPNRIFNVYNPRKPQWNQNTEVNEQINQIKWEHYYLDRADLIVMNLQEDSKSPISLMEIGMYAQSGNLIVFCPKSFYRYENVFCVCQKYGIPLYDTNDVKIIAQKVLEKLNSDLS